MTPLDVAMSAGCSDIVHYFVKTRGMDITKMDKVMLMQNFINVFMSSIYEEVWVDII